MFSLLLPDNMGQMIDGWLGRSHHGAEKYRGSETKDLKLSSPRNFEEKQKDYLLGVAQNSGSGRFSTAFLAHPQLFI